MTSSLSRQSAAMTLLPPDGANGEAVSTSTLLLEQNKEESASALHNWKDISTSNIDDALQSLHNDPVVIAELESSNDEAIVSNDDAIELNGAMNTLSVPWWDDDDGSLSSTFWDWHSNNHWYAAEALQSVEQWRRYTADPLDDAAMARLVALEEQQRAHEQAHCEQQQQRELSQWNAFPNSDHDESSRISVQDAAVVLPGSTKNDGNVNDTEKDESTNVSKNDAVPLPCANAPIMNGHHTAVVVVPTQQDDDDDDGDDAEFGDFQSAAVPAVAAHTVASSTSSSSSCNDEKAVSQCSAAALVAADQATELSEKHPPLPLKAVEHAAHTCSSAVLPISDAKAMPGDGPLAGGGGCGSLAMDSEEPAAAETDNVSPTTALVRQADALLQKFATSPTTATTNRSGSSSASSVDTPDLVHWTDQVVLQLATSSNKEPNEEAQCNGPRADIDPIRPQQLQFDDTGSQSQAVESVTATKGRQATTDDFKLDQELDCEEVSPDIPQEISSLHPQSPQQTSESSMLSVQPNLPVSLILPVEDLGTLEARFTRRRQQRYLAQQRQSATESRTRQADALDRGSFMQPTSLKDLDLPSYYFTNPNLDDTARLLESLPWKYVLPNETATSRSSHRMSRSTDCHVSSPQDLILWDESTTSRLCDLDTALETVQLEILLKVQPHQPTLERANGLIHEFDQNLRLAFMYWERSEQALSQAAGNGMVGLAGPSLIIDTCRQREEYVLLSRVVDELDKVWDRERELFQRIDRYDVKHCSALDEYRAVMDLAKSLEDIVNNGRLAKLRCLNDTRHRLTTIGEHFWHRLLELLKSVVIQCCRRNSQFEWIEYERLIRAVLDLHSQAGVDRSLRTDFATELVEHMLTMISYETDRSLAVALLHPRDPPSGSSFQEELRLLADEIDVVWGDRTKVQDIIHNLVTIRFDLESRVNYLPRVMQRLFEQLTEILHAHFLFVQWHRVPFDPQCTDVSALHGASAMEHDIKHVDLRSILSLLKSSMSQVWEQCEGVAAKCLDEYIHFARKQALFKRTDDGINDILWKEDLEALRDVWMMANRFASLKSSFLDDVDERAFELPLLERNRHCMLSEKLADVFRRHLRSVHVDAMNTMGRRLANESWVLGGFSLQGEPEHTEQPETTIGTMLQGALLEASRLCTPTSMTKAKHKAESILGMDWHGFARFETEGNPFCTPSHSPTKSLPSKTLRCSDVEKSHTQVYRTLNQLLRESDGMTRLAPEAVTRELVLWFARLLIVMENLPLITEDVSTVFANICDLYFTTVLRLSTGNEKNERLVLGSDATSPFLILRCDAPKAMVAEPKPQMFSPFRSAQHRQSHTKLLSRPRTILPSFLDGEICSPLPRDHSDMENLRSFIERAQKSLGDVVNLNMVDGWLVDPNADTCEEQMYELTRLLTKRVGAIWSCFTVAGLINATVNEARNNLEHICGAEHSILENLGSLQIYSETVFVVIPTLVKVANQVACIRVVTGSNIVKDVINVGSRWEEGRLHEQCNEYIDDLCYRNALVWGYLTASIKFSHCIVSRTWEDLVSSSYLALLEGFSRVQYCSTEGRSLMALDLAAFAAGISPSGVSNRLENIVMVHKPPIVEPECNLRCVETFLKVYYYPLNDALAWISENRVNYKLNHALSLVVASCPEQYTEKARIELVESVKLLYRSSNELVDPSS
jgi:Protein of unknown function C-terminus (DUF2451)